MSHMRSTSHTLGDADFPYIYKKGPAFGMPGVRVDGMDVMKVGSSTRWRWPICVAVCCACLHVCACD